MRVLDENMYEKVVIWKRIEAGKAVCFHCLKRLTDNMFAVQSADFFHLPINTLQLQSSDQRFVELFTEEDPSDRCQFWRKSLAEAISEHENYFAD